MSGQEKKPKPFYKDRADMLEDVGITPKQLRTWREAGLFTAELGPSTRKFTAADIARLKLLKRLIVGLGLSIDTVQHLIEASPSSSTAPLAFTYLNIKTGKLVEPRTALDEMIGLYVSASSVDKLEEWLLTLALWCFEAINRTSSSAKVYEAKRNELMEQLRRMDLAARAEAWEDDVDEEGTRWPAGQRFSPSTSEDPEPTPQLVRRLEQERSRRTQGIHQAWGKWWREGEEE